jgi:[acyl-carrier-protein] S-malonyltransferase
MTEAAKVAYVFPGQASQEVGMGFNLYQSFSVARKIFDQADAVLGFSLSQLCFNGPEDELVKTVNVQPAIVASSIACLTVAQQHDDCLGIPLFVAGHSLGEYTALVAAGALNFSDALKLVRERGRLMYEAGQRNKGGMLAIIGTELRLVEEICLYSGCEISNVNCPGQIVISGTIEALTEAGKLARDKKIRRVIPLKVSGAFHSYLMEPIIAEFQQLISDLPLRTPICPVIANVTARPIINIDEIREELVKQLRCCIQWQSSIEYMQDKGVSIFYEIGPGRVLSGLIKRIYPGAKIFNISGDDRVT